MDKLRQIALTSRYSYSELVSSLRDMKTALNNLYRPTSDAITKLEELRALGDSINPPTAKQLNRRRINAILGK